MVLWEWGGFSKPTKAPAKLKEAIGYADEYEEEMEMLRKEHETNSSSSAIGGGGAYD